MCCCETRTIHAGAGAPVSSTNARVLQVEDMSCASCANAIVRAVSKAVPDANVHVDVQSKTIRVADASNVDAVAEAIRRAGYTPIAAEAAA